VPIVRYCGYTVSCDNYHDMRRARQSSELKVCYRLESEWTPSSTLINDPLSVRGAKRIIYLETAVYFTLNNNMHK